MQGIIDRFEGSFVIVEMENGKMINIERNKIPKKAKEGNVIVIENGNIYIDYDKTRKRKQKIDKLMKKLFDKS